MEQDTEQAKPGRERKHANAAAKVKAWREKHGLVSFSVDLPAELIAQFEQWRKFKNMTRSEIIERLIRTQLLRKR